MWWEWGWLVFQMSRTSSRRSKNIWKGRQRKDFIWMYPGSNASSEQTVSKIGGGKGKAGYFLLNLRSVAICSLSLDVHQAPCQDTRGTARLIPYLARCHPPKTWKSTIVLSCTPAHTHILSLKVWAPGNLANVSQHFEHKRACLGWQLGTPALCKGVCNSEEVIGDSVKMM